MWEALIGAGSKLIGGAMNSNEQENANAANAAQNQLNLAYQHEANTKNIQWKVADAKAAGLHPLAALGVSAAGGPSASIGTNANTSMGDAVSNAGQDISRAISATQSQQKRAQAYDESLRSLDIENKSLSNELLRTRISIAKAGTPPASPSPDQAWQVPGQGDVPSVKLKPFEVTPGQPGAPWQEPGAISDVGYSRTPGGYAILPSKEAQERMEDNWLASAAWMYRNQIIPSVSRSSENPPSTAAPDGYEWRWHALRQEYRPARRRGPFGLFKEWK